MLNEAEFNTSEGNLETVISGSFRKYMEEIGEIMEKFHDAEVKVLAPSTKETINPEDEFVILVSDEPGKSPDKLEVDFMRNIRNTDFLYVADINGYVGESAATEMAYARLKNLPIVTAETVKNFTNEIPEDAQEILKKAVAKVLPKSDISKEKIEKLKEELTNSKAPDLTKDEVKILQPLIRKLLKNLESLQQ